MVGALAAPFVFQTYKARPTSPVLVALTPERKEAITAEVQNYRNSHVCEMRDDSAASACFNQHWYEGQVERGGVVPAGRSA
jgi:hypothetical protein